MVASPNAAASSCRRSASPPKLASGPRSPPRDRTAAARPSCADASAPRPAEAFVTSPYSCPSPHRGGAAASCYTLFKMQASYAALLTATSWYHAVRDPDGHRHPHPLHIALEEAAQEPWRPSGARVLRGDGSGDQAGVVAGAIFAFAISFDKTSPSRSSDQLEADPVRSSSSPISQYSFEPTARGCPPSPRGWPWCSSWASRVSWARGVHRLLRPIPR